jgi:hypothetical protein
MIFGLDNHQFNIVYLHHSYILVIITRFILAIMSCGHFVHLLGLAGNLKTIMLCNSIDNSAIRQVDTLSRTHSICII